MGEADAVIIGVIIPIANRYKIEYIIKKNAKIKGPSIDPWETHLSSSAHSLLCPLLLTWFNFNPSMDK